MLFLHPVKASNAGRTCFAACTRHTRQPLTTALCSAGVECNRVKHSEQCSAFQVVCNKLCITARAQGYTIPLDKRLAADGRGLQQTVINDKFASLSESLFMAESKAREAIQMRSNIQRQLHEKEKVGVERVCVFLEAMCASAFSASCKNA